MTVSSLWSHEVGMLFGSVTISTVGEELKISRIEKRDVPRLARALSAVDTAESQVSNITAERGPVRERRDAISQLERLATLRDRGALSEGEFEQKKKIILDKVQIKHDARLRELEGMGVAEPSRATAAKGSTIKKGARSFEKLIVLVLLLAAGVFWYRANALGAALLVVASLFFLPLVTGMLREKLYPLVAISGRAVGVLLALTVIFISSSEQRAAINDGIQSIADLRLHARARLKDPEAPELEPIQPRIVTPPSEQPAG